jgi:hypothetical protein
MFRLIFDGTYLLLCFALSALFAWGFLLQYADGHCTVPLACGISDLMRDRWGVVSLGLSLLFFWLPLRRMMDWVLGRPVRKGLP